MARQGSAWSVKGVDQATRDIARRAAQAAGMTIGEWIDHAIRADADARDAGVPAPATSHLATTGSGPNQAAHPAGGLHPDTLAAVFQRLDDTDARFDATLRPIAYALHDMAERLVALENRARAPARLALSRGQQPDPRGAHDAPVARAPTPDGPPGDWLPDLDLDAEALRRDAGVPSAARPAPVPPSTDLASEPVTNDLLDLPSDKNTQADEQPDPVIAGRIDAATPDVFTDPARHSPTRRRGWAWAAAALVLLLAVLAGAILYGADGRLDRPSLERKITEFSNSAQVAGRELWAKIDTWTAETWTGIQAEVERALGSAANNDTAAAPGAPAERSAVAPPDSPPAPTAQEPVSLESSPKVAESPRPREPEPTAALGPVIEAPVIEADELKPALAPAPAPEPLPPVADPADPPEQNDAAPPPSPALTTPSSSTPTQNGAPAPPLSAREALLVRARAGDFKAQHDLALTFANADPPNYAEAAVWFREAAINGVANAQYNLGVLHETGTGVAPDATRALLWYHSAAEQGHPLAQYNLGVLYAAGRGIPQSFAEAGRWFRRAAERGVPGALYNLAVMTYQGLGGPADPIEAERLFRRAAALGHEPALAWLRAKSAGTASDAPALAKTEIMAVDGALGADDIADIQQHLLDRGLYKGAVDGIAGPRTRAAISQYQAAQGLPVTGMPSAALAKHLQRAIN